MRALPKQKHKLTTSDAPSRALPCCVLRCKNTTHEHEAVSLCIALRWIALPRDHTRLLPSFLRAFSPSAFAESPLYERERSSPLCCSVRSRFSSHKVQIHCHCDLCESWTSLPLLDEVHCPSYNATSALEVSFWV